MIKQAAYWSRRRWGDVTPWMVAAVLVVACGVVPTAHAERVNFELASNPTGADVTGLDAWMNVQEVGDNWFFAFNNDSQITSSLTDIYFEYGFRENVFNELGPDNRALIDGVGTEFRRGARFRMPPGQNEFGWTANGFSWGAAGRGAELIENGVDTGAFEDAVVTLEMAAPSVSLAEFIEALGTRGSRIAAVVRNINGDPNSIVTLATALDTTTTPPPGPTPPPPTGTPAPTPEPTPAPGGSGGGSGGGGADVPVVQTPLPAAVWPGLVLLSGFALRRTRRAAR